MLHALRTIFWLLISIPLCSQPLVYSRDYFRWPVSNKPGIVANFGELREGHWHMGLDVRTDQRENMPVYAAAEGYIAKISVHPFGFGQAIYINHPNGLTTVYGHLNKFFPPLDSILHVWQYRRESWEIELEFTKDQFPVHQGQIIAYSGSTGSSQGPHVHFEVRDSRTERCINPFLFDFPVPDDVPPVFTKLALYDRSLSLYSQDPQLFSVKKTGNTYSLKDTLIETGCSRLGFAVGAYDCVSGSTRPNGIYGARLFVDDRLASEFALDSMDYNETSYVNAHIDYKYRFDGGPYLQLLFKLPGDLGRAYKRNMDGTVVLGDDNIHLVSIQISDVKGNTSVLKFRVRHNGKLRSASGLRQPATYLPGSANIFEQNNFEAYLPEQSLYDSIQPVFSSDDQPFPGAVSAQFQFCDASVPIRGEMRIRIRPETPIPDDLKQKLVIKSWDRKTKHIRKAEWQKDPVSGGWVSAKFNSFGFFRALIDTEPPSVNAPGRGDTMDLSVSKQIVLYPKDNTGIASFRAELDGKWLMFTNDKGAAFVYRFDERWPYGVHRLHLIIDDLVGNRTQKDWWFKRKPVTEHKRMQPAKKKQGTHATQPKSKKK